MRVSAYLNEAESALFRTNSDESLTDASVRRELPQRLAGGSGRTPKGEKGKDMTVAVALILGALVIALEIWCEINK